MQWRQAADSTVYVAASPRPPLSALCAFLFSVPECSVQTLADIVAHGGPLSISVCGELPYVSLGNAPAI